jgi:hypothetical protein
LLDRYAGRYRLAPGSTLTVWHRGPHLYAQLTDQAPFAFQPDSNVSFRNETVGAELLFEPLAEGAVAAAVTLRQGGRDQPAPRITEAIATPVK